MPQIQQRPGVATSLGDHEKRIRALERSAPPGGSCWTFIQEIELVANGTIDFVAIPQTYRHLQLKAQIALPDESDIMGLWLNNDDPTNTTDGLFYSVMRQFWRNMYGYGYPPGRSIFGDSQGLECDPCNLSDFNWGVLPNIEYSDAEFFYVCGRRALHDDPKAWTNFTLDIPYYTRDTYKAMPFRIDGWGFADTQEGGDPDNAKRNYLQMIGTVFYVGPDPITEIHLGQQQNIADGLAADSIASLYGIC